MKYLGSRLRKTKNIVRFITICITLIFVIHLISYYKPNLYFADKYLWYIHMGEKNYDIFKNDKSFKYATKAIYLDPKRPEAHKLKVNIYRNSGLYSKVEEELSLLKGMNELSFYYFYMGFIRLEQDMINESLSYFKEGIEQDPFFVGHHVGVGFVYLKMNNSKNAFEYLNQSKSFVNRSYIDQPSKKLLLFGLIHAGLGFIYQQKGEYEKANKEFEKAESFDYKTVEWVRQLIS